MPKKKPTDGVSFSKKFAGGAVSGFTTGCVACITGEASDCPHFGKEQKPPTDCPLTK
jgi:hypothetical protein